VERKEKKRGAKHITEDIGRLQHGPKRWRRKGGRRAGGAKKTANGGGLSLGPQYTALPHGKISTSKNWVSSNVGEKIREGKKGKEGGTIHKEGGA